MKAKIILAVILLLIGIVGAYFFILPTFMERQIIKEQAEISSEYPWTADIKSQLSRELNLKEGYPDINIETDEKTGKPLISLYFPTTHLFGASTGDKGEETKFGQEVRLAAKSACENAPSKEEYIVRIKTIQYLTEEQRKTVNNRALENTNEYSCLDF